MRTRTRNCQIPLRPASPKSFFGWIVVAPLITVFAKFARKGFVAEFKSKWVK